MKLNPNLSPFLSMMSTSTLAPVLPDFVEDYGENKRLDVKVSLSQAKFLEGFPGSKMTGIYIDKNGNWKVQLNLVLSIEVETDRNVWEPARSLYLTLVATAKTHMDDKNPFAK